MNKRSSLWISWENHRRTKELASNLPSVELCILEFCGAKIIRYPYLLSKTLLLLLKKRPDVIFVQSPSIVLALFMVTMGKYFTRFIIVDAHNEGLRPFSNKLDWLLPLYRFIQRQSYLTIVTNEELGKEVENNGGRPFVLQDKIPHVTCHKRISLKGRSNIVFICTFEKDEPYEEVIKAASIIDASTVIYITGNKQKAQREIIEKASQNIVFTGFIPESEYFNLLYSCDAIMDLTLMENCLVCGAYEAVAMNKPIILSDTKALREYFNIGAVFTKSDAESIANAISIITRDREYLERDVQILEKNLLADWHKRKQSLICFLDLVNSETEKKKS